MHSPFDGLAALLERRRERAGHEAQPGAVGGGLVLAVDGGDRVLQVDDRGDRRLQHHVGDARVVLSANPGIRVDHQLDVQAVAAQQDRAVRPACELGRIGQGRRQRTVLDAVLRDVRVAALGEREQLVQQGVSGRDHLGAALLVVAGCELVVLRERVGAVERVVERAPPGVGRVECVTRHRGGHHQLGACDLGDLAVHAGDGQVRGRVRNQVADLGEERGVGVRVARAVLAVPRVDTFLQLVAAREQRGDAKANRLWRSTSAVQNRSGSMSSPRSSSSTTKERRVGSIRRSLVTRGTLGGTDHSRQRERQRGERSEDEQELERPPWAHARLLGAGHVACANGDTVAADPPRWGSASGDHGRIRHRVVLSSCSFDGEEMRWGSTVRCGRRSSGRSPPRT